MAIQQCQILYYTSPGKVPIFVCPDTPNRVIQHLAMTATLLIYLLVMLYISYQYYQRVLFSAPIVRSRRDHVAWLERTQGFAGMEYYDLDDEWSDLEDLSDSEGEDSDSEGEGSVDERERSNLPDAEEGNGADEGDGAEAWGDGQRQFGLFVDGWGYVIYEFISWL